MNHKRLLCSILALALGGCVPVLSLHPLFTEENTVFEKKLLGAWVDDPNSPDTTWQFGDINEPKNAYKLIFMDEEGKKGSFVARLVKLQNKLFLDLCPSELPWEPDDPNKIDWPYNAFFLVPAHTFLKIDSIEPQLKMRLALESKIEDLLKEDPNAVKYVKVEDRIVLTASTKELQAFVLKHVDDDKLFTDQVTLSRKDAKTGNP
ncbi:MAG: hypothetical protein A2Z25_24275 [Planctomycetes bacterium RBG_16_55_9]|nr:MAG: hypothetical protein A2Z25_24275 [Planctomycetes bacterium RBG_16_55_9]